MSSLKSASHFNTSSLPCLFHLSYPKHTNHHLSAPERTRIQIHLACKAL